MFSAVPMNKRIFSFWVMTAVGVVAFGWMIAELVRVVLEVANASGFRSLLMDGVVQHKVGELMVGIPFVTILALSNLWAKERVRSLIRGLAAVMLVGGVLNAIAWYSLSDRIAAGDFLRIWCLIIFVFGLTGPWLLTRMLDRMIIKG